MGDVEFFEVGHQANDVCARYKGLSGGLSVSLNLGNRTGISVRQMDGRLGIVQSRGDWDSHNVDQAPINPVALRHTQQLMLGLRMSIVMPETVELSPIGFTSIPELLRTKTDRRI